MSECCPCRTRLVNALAITGALLVMGFMVWLMVRYTRPEDLNAKRAAERAKALAEINAQNKEALENYGWVDQAKGIVRLPITRAMEITARDWQNPAAARASLLERVEKATAKPPEKPSEFE